MTKVLFVCLGNICRSPMAEAVFADLIESQGLKNQFEVNSAGTANYHIGAKPDHRTIKVCEHNGIEINHKGQQITAKDLDYYDFVIAMDFDNYTNIMKLSSKNEHHEKIFMMRNFTHKDQNLPIPDPYYGNMEHFEEVYEMLKEDCNNLLKQIKS
jgi:protein-tyrosine phosphatase